MIDKFIKKLGKEGKPSKKFDKILQAKLMERFEETYPSKSSFFSFKKLKLQFAVAFIITAFSGTSIFAYSSDKVTSKHFLYPVKRNLENVEGWFATTPEKKEKYHIKMSERRLEELPHLEKNGEHYRETIIEGNMNRNLFKLHHHLLQTFEKPNAEFKERPTELIPEERPEHEDRTKLEIIEERIIEGHIEDRNKL
jgi:hypothetical protein